MHVMVLLTQVDATLETSKFIWIHILFMPLTNFNF